MGVSPVQCEISPAESGGVGTSFGVPPAIGNRLLPDRGQQQRPEVLAKQWIRTAAATPELPVREGHVRVISATTGAADIPLNPGGRGGEGEYPALIEVDKRPVKYDRIPKKLDYVSIGKRHRKVLSYRERFVCQGGWVPSGKLHANRPGVRRSCC